MRVHLIQNLATYGQVVLCITLEICLNLFIRYTIRMSCPPMFTQIYGGDQKQPAGSNTLL